MKNVALMAVFLATVAVAAVYVATLVQGTAPAWAAPVFAVAIAVLLVGLMVVGAARSRGGLGWLWAAFVFVFVVIAGGFIAALVLPVEAAGADLWLGLPPRAAIIMYGVGLLPAFVVPVAYAMTFDRLTLSRADLERVRALAAASAPDDEPAAAAGAHR